MGWIEWIFIYIMLSRAIYTDVKEGKIENKNMILSLLPAMVCAYWRGNIKGLLESGKMMLLVFLVLIMVYAFKGIGAGDVKLLCVLAAFFQKQAWSVVVAAFVVAGIISIGKMMVRWIQKKKIINRGETMAFSVPVGIGTGIVLLQQYVK